MQELVHIESPIVSPPRIPLAIPSQQTKYVVLHRTPRAAKRGDMAIVVFDGLRLSQGAKQVSINDKSSFSSVVIVQGCSEQAGAKENGPHIARSSWKCPKACL